MEYNCAYDEYKRGTEVIQGWESLVNRHQNVRRIRDSAENVAFLCQTEDGSDGEICWCFDFNDQHVKNIEIGVSGIRKTENVRLFFLTTYLVNAFDRIVILNYWS